MINEIHNKLLNLGFTPRNNDYSMEKLKRNVYTYKASKDKDNFTYNNNKLSLRLTEKPKFLLVEIIESEYKFSNIPVKQLKITNLDEENIKSVDNFINDYLKMIKEGK